LTFLTLGSVECFPCGELPAGQTACQSGLQTKGRR
jgi:hypothetical protein